MARATPFGPEIDQEETRSADLPIERRVGELNRADISSGDRLRSGCGHEPPQLAGADRSELRILHRSVQAESPIKGFVALSGDLRHGAELFRKRAEESHLAPDERDLAVVEGGRVEWDDEDGLPHRDGLVQVMQECEDGSEVVVGDQVLKAVQQDDAVLADLD